ncbi:phosphotransferase family protein [Peribacillus sp. SCS-155]|uniref:phosphotransferase family protein n=1 Tax=Peribacillus sedimenti TaxID=3115297 RepID=UPI003905CDAC
MANTNSSDTISVRSGEELNIPVLEKFLKENVEGYPDRMLEIKQFSAGHSNLTYELKAGDWEAVLRRPPHGPVAPKAHDMKREHFIVQTLHPYFPEAPKPILYSDDESIVGSQFFIMERKKGVVLDTAFPDSWNVDGQLCRRLSEIMVEKLVELHSIPYRETGLQEISRPEGFMERQIHGWISRYERAKTDDIKEAPQLLNWLATHLPKESGHAIIHYDYKLNNAMFNQEGTDMVGLFDWEMATVGDPLADLGIAMGYWTEQNDPDLLKFGMGKASVTVNEGFMSRREFIESYARKSGRDVSNIDFYLTFAYFKLAVICQQIYYRYKKGQTNDQRFASFNHFVKSLITHASNIAGKEVL